MAQTLNRPLLVRDDQVLIVRASVTQPERDPHWRVAIETDNGLRRSGRSLDAASCDELAEATALLIAILIEPDVERTGTSASGRRAAPSSTTPAPALATLPAPERKPLHFGVGAFSGALSGLLPAWSFGLGLDGELGWKMLRFRVSAGYWLPVEQAAPDNPAQGARFRHVSAATELCLVQPFFGVSGGICSGAALSFVNARGFGQGVAPKDEQAQFVSFSAGVLLSWAASQRLTLVLDADALIPLGSRHFVFEGGAPAQVHTPSVGARLSFGVQFMLGRTNPSGSGPISLK